MSSQQQQQEQLRPCSWHLWHEPSLWHPNDQPNGNIIYHLQSDGKITYQKGGWAYGARTEFVDEPALTHRRNVPGVDVSQFPNQFIENDGRVVHYIIVDRDIARKLRQHAVNGSDDCLTAKKTLD
jgi:hypothetical protein